MTGFDKVFEGLKVVELASVLAGPAVGMFFAELGAQVLKVENKATQGDVTRAWKLPKEDPKKPWSAYFHAVNWNKTYLPLDLKTPAECQQVLQHIADADIVISNFKSGSAAQFGLDYDSLKLRFPQLIYASITAYGQHKPKPGFDVAIQAETGWIYMNGEAAGAPVKMPVALIDLLAAHQLKEGILVALLQRQRSGRGCHVTTSLFDASIASLANQASNWLNLQHVPQKMGSQHPNIAPYGDTFTTKDGKSLILATGTQKHFEQLCKCLALPAIIEDPRFVTNALRLQNRDMLIQKLAHAFSQWTAEELLSRFEKAQVPVSPIRDLSEVFELPQAQALVLVETLPDGSQSQRVRTAVFQKVDTM
ncbi:MAG: CoA transferase [Saprospiraceae bacterium]|nr:CoA transferase [Saprospiraceae bacterium]